MATDVDDTTDLVTHRLHGLLFPQDDEKQAARAASDAHSATKLTLRLD